MIEYMFDFNNRQYPPAVVTHEELAGWVGRLGGGVPVAGGDADAIDQIGVLERLKSAAAAWQAELTAAFAVSQRVAQRTAGVGAAEVGRGIGSQVGLARRDSPHKGGRHLGLAGVGDGYAAHAGGAAARRHIRVAGDPDGA